LAKKNAAPALNWPADKSERVPLKKLVPYARNARKHSPEQVAQIRASMREFGWTMPVLRDEKGGIIAGHGRVMAAQAELDDGNKDFETVPCVTARGWSEAKKRAYVIADNKLTLNASWDLDLLAAELSDLSEEHRRLTGFAQSEIDSLLSGWDSDINDLVGKHGENLDGIKASIVLQVEQEQEDAAREVIKKALDKAGIEHDL
jgi:ParB-like chromosome segregation protein Spo0J